ncbi:spore germination protein [Paenibacillus soyae]|uniref:Spore germination protein n=1 Tax=Paenibacillus soyae TaxID=2969249 RepID=A0A9X2MT43_9BACL|nr:spore germination protein [Paenibacillus soyae]MCR2805368.1 spore germination protein [Paenibacillus soyae]
MSSSPPMPVDQALERQRALLSLSLSGQLDQDIGILRQLFEDGSDIIFRAFRLANGADLALVYVDGMTAIQEVDMSIMRPLKQRTDADTPADWSSLLMEVTLPSSSRITTMEDASDAISSGSTLLLMQGEASAVVFSMPYWNSRSITEPEAESVIRGPREGFVETLRLNTVMLRRRIQSPAFKLKELKIGRYSKTTCAIAYMDGIVDPGLVAEMEQRLKRIDVDMLIDSSLIEEFIEDDPFTPFPQVQTTERPDVVSAAIMEGRVAVLVNGSPIALIAPTTLFILMMSPEDYYQRSYVSTAIRWIRLIFAFIAVFMPSIYVAVLSYHQEMIPSTLMLTISKSREQIPFPALVEALLMEATFEALREANVRLPKQVGSAVSIVGALVIGQAAISAGIVSSPMIMVVAITGVASFLIPSYPLGLALRIIRFPIMLGAGILGLYGIVLVAMMLTIHLLALRSFGVPYLSPMAPLMWDQLGDTVIREPLWAHDTRPHWTGGLRNKLRLRAPKSKQHHAKE